MVGTQKKALQTVTQSECKEWDQSLEDVLYGYRRRVKPKFSILPSVRTPGAEVLYRARSFELALALINPAERLVPRTVHGDTR